MPAPRVEIAYCPRCRWLLRAAWLAQELLTTFETELGEVALVPAAQSGTFDVRLDGQLVFSRREARRFPESKELKRLLRDRIAPGRDLGHTDRASGAEAGDAEPSPALEEAGGETQPDPEEAAARGETQPDPDEAAARGETERGAR